MARWASGSGISLATRPLRRRRPVGRVPLVARRSHLQPAGENRPTELLELLAREHVQLSFESIDQRLQLGHIEPLIRLIGSSRGIRFDLIGAPRVGNSSSLLMRTPSLPLPARRRWPPLRSGCRRSLLPPVLVVCLLRDCHFNALQLSQYVAELGE